MSPAAVLAFAAGIMAGATISAGTACDGGTWRAAAPEPPAAAPMRYPAEVVRVIDGDTFEARVRIWPGLEVLTKVRLRGIDAPELNARCADEQSAAQDALAALSAMLAQGEVGVGAVALDKYGGRVVAAASARGTADVAAALIAAGLVRPYRGGRRESWCRY